jgi:4-aminobutyrate aminotransferase/(S)-3-amino-2-methylpropionate transaminase
MSKAINLVTDLPGPRSAEILERKSRFVCDPLDIHVPAVIDRGLGARVTDVDGNTFLDFSAGLGCQLVGYSHPKVVQAVQRQVARFSHTDFSVIPYESYVELAERLTALTGVRDGKVALFNAGAEAVENAVKFAKAATGRSALLCFEGGFHGRTLLTMSLTSRHHPYKAGFGPFAPEVYRLPYPYPYRSAHPEEAGRLALEAIERAFVTVVDPASVAAAIVEPIQGEGGFVVPTPDFLQGLATLCHRHGILVIADEVQTGCGRTGHFLASEHFGLEPCWPRHSRRVTPCRRWLRRGRSWTRPGHPRSEVPTSEIRWPVPRRTPSSRSSRRRDCWSVRSRSVRSCGPGGNRSRRRFPKWVRFAASAR